MGSKLRQRSGISRHFVVSRDVSCSSCFSVHTRASWCCISETASSSNLEAVLIGIESSYCACWNSRYNQIIELSLIAIGSWDPCTIENTLYASINATWILWRWKSWRLSSEDQLSQPIPDMMVVELISLNFSHPKRGNKSRMKPQVRRIFKRRQ